MFIIVFIKLFVCSFFVILVGSSFDVKYFKSFDLFLEEKVKAFVFREVTSHGNFSRDYFSFAKKVINYYQSVMYTKKIQKV